MVLPENQPWGTHLGIAYSENRCGLSRLGRPFRCHQAPRRTHRFNFSPKQSLSHEDSKTIAFRVSVEDHTKIHMLIEISGMVKQDYLLARALDEQIIVYPNVRIQKYLEKYLIEIANEFQRLAPGNTIPPEIIEKFNILLTVISQMSKPLLRYSAQQGQIHAVFRGHFGVTCSKSLDFTGF